MRLLNLLWLVCLFVLFDQIHLQNFLPPSSAFVTSQKAENPRVAPETAPIAIRFADEAVSEETVALANPETDFEPLGAKSTDRIEPDPTSPAYDPAASPESQTSAETPAPRRQVSREELCDALISAAQSNNLPVGFLARLIWQESGFDSNVVSRAGAQGMAQFMPKVAAEWGVDDPFDPLQALPASARLLRTLRQQFGNLGLAAAAYNAGSGRIQNWLTRRGKLPEETRSYVMNITGHPAEKWVKAAPHSISFHVPNRAPCREIAAELDAAVVPLPLPRPAAPIVTASADANFKTIKTGSAAPRAPLPAIASPAPIIAAHWSGKTVKVASTPSLKVVTSGKRQQLVLPVKEAKKSPAQVKIQVAAATKPAKKAGPAAKIAPKPATKTASKGPLQLAMVVRSSKK